MLVGSQLGFTAIGGVSLQSVVTSCVCDLDATIAASYTTGQTWSNLVPNPADSSAQTAYDFYLGAGSGSSTDDPTFTGTPGTTSAYFALDGGDFFTLKSGANTTFINTWHKSAGAAFWVACAFRIANAAGNQIICATSTDTGPSIGCSFLSSGAEALQWRQQGDSNNQVAGAMGTLTPGTDYLIIASHNNGTNNTRAWVNTTTASDVGQTYASTSSSASGALQIGSHSGGSDALVNGARIYHFSSGNEYLDNTKAALIYAALNTRHGRTYA